MSNQWGRQPMGKDSWILVLGVVIIGIIGYLFIPNLIKPFNSSTDPTVPATILNSDNQPSTNDPYALNSSGYPIQNLPSVNNTLNNGNGNNEITTGYWILFLYNGTIQQLPINAQDYAFVQGLVNSDTKGTPTNPLFLVENGQIQKYVVSNETYSIISNIATINRRSSTSLPDINQTPSPTPTIPTLPTRPTPTIPSTSTPSTSSPSTSSPSTSSPSTTVPSPYNP
ncbi:MAG: hypothetical protein P4L69_03950 [Desulfosporosinus sp.]|nr:hypothetical protein [Desulfosporosinus sp.]